MNAAIPQDEVTAEDLKQWYLLHEQLGKLKSAEALLRGRIFKGMVKDPKEGTNTVPLNDGTGAVLKAQHVINRSVDVGTLDALRKAQADALAMQQQPSTVAAEGVVPPNAPKLPFDELIKWKPELSITKYKELTAEERMYFDQCLVIKPGSPQLEIVIPKRAAKG
jgi:hypothetical protein